MALTTPQVLRIVTHLSTDGENKNVGEHKGLLKLIDEERVKLGHDNKPLLKLVCLVHSSALAYKDLCKSVPAIKYNVESLTGMSTYFHTSARCSTDVSEIAKESNFTCMPSFSNIVLGAMVLVYWLITPCCTKLMAIGEH